MKIFFTKLLCKNFTRIIILGVLFISISDAFGQGTFNSIGGNYSLAGSWQLIAGSDIDGIPDGNDIITVLAGHSIVVDNNVAACSSLTVNGTLTFGIGVTSRTLTVSNGVTLASGGLINTNNPGSPVQHHLIVGGNFTNNGGTYTGLTGNGSLMLTFNGGGAQVINGTAVNQTFNDVTVNKSAGTVTAGGSTTTISVDDYTQTQGNFAAPATFSVNGNVVFSLGTFTGGATMNVTGNVTLGSATFIAAATSTNLSGNYTNNGGTFTPGTGTVTFNGTGAQSINGAVGSQMFYNIIVNKAAGQTLSVGGSTTVLNISNDFTQTSGNFTGSANLSVARDVTLSSGTFTAGSSTSITRHLTIGAGSTLIAGTNTSVGGNFTNNGGTFTPGTGTVTFTGNTASINGTAASQTFYNVIVNKTAGQTSSVGGSTTTLNITNDFTLTSGNFTAPTNLSVTRDVTLSSGIFTSGTTASITRNIIVDAGSTWIAGNSTSVGGNLTNNGGTFTPGTGTVTFTGNTASINGTAASQTFNNIVINKTAGQTLAVNGSTTAITVTNFTLSTGNFTSPASTTATGDVLLSAGTTLTAGANNFIGGNLTNNGATLAGSGTITFDGAAAQSITGISTQVFDLFVVNKPAGQTLTASSLTTLGANAITLASGNFMAPPTVNVGAITITTGTYTAGATTTISGNFVTNGGIFVAGANTSVGGNFTNNGGTFSPGSNTITFTGNNSLINGTASLQAFNNVVINKTAGQTLTVGGSIATLNVANLTQTTGNFSAPATLNVSANIILTAGTFTAGTNTNVTGHFTNNGATLSPGSGTFTFNGVTQTVGGSSSTTFNHVVTTGSTSVTTGGLLVIGGNLTIANSTTFTASGFDLTVIGMTTIGSGTSGILNISSATGSKTFSGLITIASGAIWNNTGNAPITFNGGINKVGTFTAGSGLHTFNTNSQSLTGIFNIPNISVSGSSVTLTNNNTLTISTALSGTGGLTQAGGSTLNIIGTASISTLTAVSSGNTVNYTGSAQTVIGTSYAILGINQSAGDAVLGGSTSVSEILRFTNGSLDIGTNILTIGSTGSIAFVGPGASASKMIFGSAGSEIRKMYTATGSFTFPIGDNLAVAEYAPITVNVTAGTFISAYVGVSVYDAKHPSNQSASHFLTRYWNVSQSGITGCQLNITGTYLPGDITGTEGNIRAAQLTGTFNQLTNPWVKSASVLGGNTVTFLNASLMSGQTSAFTGITSSDVNVVITGGGIAICKGTTTPLGTTVTGGDPGYIYSWTGAGLSNNAIANPTVTPIVTTVYSLTVTDANGITDTDNTTITVDPIPTITAQPLSLTRCSGTSASFGVTATGSILIYQWRRNGTPLSNGGVYSGVLTQTLTISDVTGLNGNTFDLIVTETSGTQHCPVTSTAATLIVDPLPDATASNQTICSGSSTNIPLSTPNGVAGTTYTWIVWSNTGAVTGASAGSGNSIGQTLVNPTNVQQMVTYRITPRSGAGCNGPTFDVNALVDPTPNVQATPSALTICSGSSTNIALSTPNGVAGSQYTWTVSQSGVTGATAQAVAGPGPIAQSLTTTAASQGTATYTITPQTSSCTGSPIMVVVTVDPLPNATASNQTICSGSSTSMPISTPNGVAGTTYTWIVWSNTGTVTGASAGSGNSIGQTLVNPTNVQQTVTYRITPRSGAGCNGPTFDVNALVQPHLIFSITNATSIICEGIPADITLNSPTSGAQIRLTSVSYGTATGGTHLAGDLFSDGQKITETLGNPGNAPITVTYTFEVLANGCTNPVTQQTFITLNPDPVFSISNTTTNICEGTGANIILNTPTSGGQVKLTAVNYSSATGGTQTIGNIYTNGQKITETLGNPGTTPIAVTYTFEVSANGCTNATTQQTSIILNPDPVFSITNATTSICEGVAANITLNSPTSGAQIRLTSVSYGTATGGTHSAGDLFSDGQKITETLSNPGTAPITVAYTFEVLANGCTNPVTQQTSIILNPRPVGIVNSTTLCSDQPLGLGIMLNTSAASIDAASYNISVNANGLIQSAGTNSNGTGKSATELIGDAWTNPGNIPIDVLYTIIPVSDAGCAGVPFLVTVTINPEPVGVANSATVCSDEVLGGTTTLSTTGSSIAAANFSIAINANGLSQSAGTNSAGASKANNELVDDAWKNPGATSVNVIYTITPVSGAGCMGDSFPVTITVNPEPVGLASTTTVCSDEALGPIVTLNTSGSSVAANNFTIAVSNNGLAQSGGSNSNGALKASNELVGDAWTNTSGAAVNVTYAITPASASNCAGDSFAVTVTINPEPVGMAAAKTVCSDVAVDYNLINNVAISGNNVGSTFSWIAASNGNVTGENSVSAQTGPVITDVLNNVTNTQQTVGYTITPTSVAGCAGNTFPITITVNPEPVGISTTVVICSNLSVAYDLQNNVNSVGNSLPTNFSWNATANGSILGESTSVKNSSLIDDELTNNTNAVDSIIYTINPTAQGTGCVGNTFIIKTKVNPRAKISAGPDLALCKNIPSIVLQGSINYAPNGVLWTGGAGSYSSATNINSSYSFSDPSEVNTAITFQVAAIDPDGAGPCPQETDQMTLRINPLPVVVFTGLPPGVPPQMAENNAPITLTGNQIGGVFTISPITSNIGSTVPNPVDKALFDPSAVTLGSNFITYTYTNANNCTNTDRQEVIVNPVTDVDFTIEGATFNSSGQHELCSQLGRVRLIGFPAASTGLAPETQFTSIPAYAGGPVATIVKDGSDYYIQTDGLVSQTYRIRYDYKNSFGALTFQIKEVKIFASPVAQFTSSNNCIASDVLFTDGSTINPTPFPTNIASWQWNFGDNTSSNNQNANKKYDASSTYYVTLKVTTLQGCSNTTPPLANPIRVGDVPTPDFTWSSICNRDFTKFQDRSDPGSISIITSYIWEFGDADILTGGSGQNVPLSYHGGKTTGTYNLPDHKYDAYGTYDVKLTVTTNDGCYNSVVKKVFILPYSTVRPLSNAAYFEPFEATNGGWIPEAFEATNLNVQSDTSWIWGIPTGQHIKSGARNSLRAWWTGKNTNGQSTYYSYENSVVNGPCFDLSALNRPMVSLDYFSDADLSDGAVLQYSIDGGNNWRIVGPNEALQDRDQGINWFNGNPIVANPGKQFLGQYGWTGNADQAQGKWKNGRFNLDMIPVANRGQVRLRIAFASNDGNPGSGPYEGFAFDNFFVGDKKRTVMVEHFTNASLPQGTKIASQEIDDLFANQSVVRLQPDFFKLQYHMGVPGTDQMNKDNPMDPSARAFFYQNIVSPPFTIMDGILGQFYNKTFQGGHKAINEIEIDRRALEDPPFIIDSVRFDPTASQDVLRATVDFVYIDSVASLNSPVTFHAALVETDVLNNKNVLRKLLWKSEGITRNQNWRYRDALSIDIDYTIDVPIADPSKLYVVIFIQDFGTGKIHQAAIVKAPMKVGVTLVEVDDEPATAEIKNIAVYPNPASQQINFYLENILTHEYQWEIIDQRGVTVLDGKLANDLSIPQQVEIKDLANGIYFVRFTWAGNNLVYRKIAIMNRH